MWEWILLAIVVMIPLFLFVAIALACVVIFGPEKCAKEIKNVLAVLRSIKQVDQDVKIRVKCGECNHEQRYTVKQFKGWLGKLSCAYCKQQSSFIDITAVLYPDKKRADTKELKDTPGNTKKPKEDKKKGGVPTLDFEFKPGVD